MVVVVAPRASALSAPSADAALPSPLPSPLGGATGRLPYCSNTRRHLRPPERRDDDAPTDGDDGDDPVDGDCNDDDSGGGGDDGDNDVIGDDVLLWPFSLASGNAEPLSALSAAAIFAPAAAAASSAAAQQQVPVDDPSTAARVQTSVGAAVVVASGTAVVDVDDVLVAFAASGEGAGCLDAPTAR